MAIYPISDGDRFLQEMGRVFIAGIASEVKQAKINATTSGETQVVAAVTGKKLRVISVIFTTSAAISIGWRSASNVKIDPMSFAQNGGMTEQWRRGHFFETNTGEALNIYLSSNANVRGSLCYVEV